MNAIKSLTLLSLLMLLTACGQKADQPTEASTAAAETSETETVSANPAVAESAAESEAGLAAVEESDGSFDAEEVAEEGSLRMAQNTAPAPQQRFSEGKEYERFRPAKMTVGDGEKIEVVEVFWYGCGHCYTLEPVLNRWSRNLPDGVELIKLPVAWPQAEKHVQVFYTIEALGGNGTIENTMAAHQAVFDAIHIDRKRVMREGEVLDLLSRFGVDKDAFENAWNSFEVNTRVRQAKTLTRTYNIQSVPTMLVDGKYVTSETQAGGKPELLAVLDELIAIEKAQ